MIAALLNLAALAYWIALEQDAMNRHIVRAIGQGEGTGIEHGVKGTKIPRL